MFLSAWPKACGFLSVRKFVFSCEFILFYFRSKSLALDSRFRFPNLRALLSSHDSSSARIRILIHTGHTVFMHTMFILSQLGLSGVRMTFGLSGFTVGGRFTYQALKVVLEPISRNWQQHCFKILWSFNLCPSAIHRWSMVATLAVRLIDLIIFLHPTRRNFSYTKTLLILFFKKRLFYPA